MGQHKTGYACGKHVLAAALVIEGTQPKELVTAFGVSLKEIYYPEVQFDGGIVMAIPKGPTEGGSGGKRGHSNMEHWVYSHEVKQASKKRRRLDSKKKTRDAQQSRVRSK